MGCYVVHVIGQLGFRCHYLFLFDDLSGLTFQTESLDIFDLYTGGFTGICNIYCVGDGVSVSVLWLYQIMSCSVPQGLLCLVLMRMQLVFFSILACIGGCAGSTSEVKFARLIYFIVN